ncbi:MAG: hypothetical protein WC767_03465 [Candidatus Paceibacterota bacterium]|jgi:hypothetical protein
MDTKLSADLRVTSSVISEFTGSPVCCIDFKGEITIFDPLYMADHLSDMLSVLLESARIKKLRSTP